MARKRRYYSEDDQELGVTPSAFKRLGRERQKEYMRYWFRRNFEDPAEETPYSSEEGGYLFIWGGPYDTREQLNDEFGALVPEETIEELTAEVERRGISDWAPGPDHPDHERAQREWYAEHPSEEDARPYHEDLNVIVRRIEGGLKPRYGDGYELERRGEVLRRLDQLKLALMALRPAHGGVGHNRPPPDDDRPQVSVIDEIREAGEIIGRELAKQEPDALQVAKATSRLQTALGWLGKKVDGAVDSFAKGFGNAAGNVAGAGLVTVTGAYVYPPLGNLVSEVVTHVSQWLSHVTFPF